MVAIGSIALFLGFLALVGGVVSRVRAGRIANTPFATTGDIASKGATVAGEKGAISTQGRVLAQQLATSPVSGTQCLYYDVVVTARWKAGDSEQTLRVSEEKVAAPFALDDGSGAIRIDASKGGDFETKTTFQKKQSRGLMSAFTGKPLSFGDRGFTIPQGIRVGMTVVPDHAEFEVVERCLPAAERLYANGKLDNGTIGSPNWTALVLSNKTRDELLAGTAQMAKMLLIGGAATSAAGALVAAIGAMMG
jgi:hypothetical protein